MHLIEALLHAGGDLLLGHVGMAAQREGDVLEHRHRIEQRPFLKGHAEAAAEPVEVDRPHAAEVLPLDVHVTAVRLHQSDDVLEGDALAGAGAADDDHRLAGLHVDGQVAQHRLAVERLRDLLQRDGGVFARHLRDRLRSNRVCHQNRILVRKKSVSRMISDALTTALVVERPTPSAPPVV